jgi:epoxyqueuosine reductase
MTLIDCLPFFLDDIWLVLYLVYNRRFYTDNIKKEAIRLGFDNCGIAKAAFLEEEAHHLETWLKKGYHGSMAYMENHFDKRLDPCLLVPDAKSVICLTYNHFPQKIQEQSSYKIAKYAYGEDYHFVLKRKLKELLQYIQSIMGDVNGRVFVDSAPVLERAWAERSGLGWRGKHSLLIEKGKGSFTFLAEIIIDAELDYDAPFPTDHCGSCTRCIDACPTAAILPDNTVDGSKCISFFTIELKEAIPVSFNGSFADWIFGCDICQDVCPWNRFATAHDTAEFLPHDDLLTMTKTDWEHLTETTFQKLFRRSAVKRTKFLGLKRNIDFIKT